MSGWLKSLIGSKPASPQTATQWPEASNVIGGLFAELFLGWTRGVAPPDPMEGVHPDFAALFGETPVEFTFDRFLHGQETADWSWLPLQMDEVTDGTFMLYRPDAWSETIVRAPGAQLLADGRPRQSFMLIAMDEWAPMLPDFVETATVVAFDFLPVSERFSRWIFVTRADDTYWCWGAYRADEWVVVIKGDAVGVVEVGEQLQALANSNPWYALIHQ